jgi:flagellar protein FlaG
VSIQQLNGTGIGAQAGATAATATIATATNGLVPDQAHALRADKGDRADVGVPSSPPPDVLEQISAAGARFSELLDQQRHLHFSHDDTTNRVVVQVRDLDGNVLRTIPPSKALEVISGASID